MATSWGFKSPRPHNNNKLASPIMLVRWPAKLVVRGANQIRNMAGQRRASELAVTRPSVLQAGRGGYPVLSGGLWLLKTLVPSGLRAVVVPSGLLVTVQPRAW